MTCPRWIFKRPTPLLVEVPLRRQRHDRANDQAHPVPQSDIVIGLVNIMPPNALKATENMFRRLLHSSSRNRNVHLRLFTSGNFAAGMHGQSVVPPHYENLDALWQANTGALPVDALIVTGTEPRAALMQDEPSWPQLQKICDWAAENTVSTLWSCFAAHAAVLHIDGIRRQRRGEKLSGVFECRKASEHSLLQAMPPQWSVPHSRFNGLDAAELSAANYQILSHAPYLGVDSFVKRYGNSEFLFFQGHPEYERQTLFGEYQRDCRRFAAGESLNYPNFPENYFDPETILAIERLREGAQRPPESLFPPEFVKTVISKLVDHWRTPARQLVGAWISFIAEQKSQNKAESHAYQSRSAAAG